jgi:excisionase family DNA binding protein
MIGDVDSIMTLEDLSVYLKIPKSSLYKIVREGTIPAQKIGKHWRFDRKAIDAWMSNGTLR